jgi:hypothetical protein
MAMTTAMTDAPVALPETDSFQPLTTKEGWARWVQQDYLPPEEPTAGPDLAPDAWAAYDQARLDYHSDLIVVNTPTIQQIITIVRRLLVLNRRRVSARRGLIVTGDGGTGKTTAITQLGRAHELNVRLRNPVAGPRIPVVYVTLPTSATPRMLAVEFARFLGLPLTGRANITDITNAVCTVLCEVGTDLVLVDEIHNISLASRNGAEVSDALKYFSERIPATFVYAGIDVEQRGLFAGTRGRQIASRFTTVPTRPFAYGSATDRAHWRAVVATFEQSLRLRHHKPGALTRHATYLYERTQGMMGSLAALIQSAATDVILDGTEKITKAHLDAIQLDHAAALTARRSRKRTGTG